MSFRTRLIIAKGICVCMLVAACQRLAAMYGVSLGLLLIFPAMIGMICPELLIWVYERTTGRIIVDDECGS